MKNHEFSVSLQPQNTGQPSSTPLCLFDRTFVCLSIAQRGRGRNASIRLVERRGFAKTMQTG
ncbi:MAG TPA: hypothetical protein VF681_03920 [Abditibacteriaceae bacterium]|jgi:hypothetical protein